MSEELHLFHLLQESEAETARWRRRTMFLVSVLFHAFMVIFGLVAPQLFRRGAQMLGIVVQPRPQRETTYLYMPPEPLKKVPPPDTHILSDKNRIAQGKAPKIDPNALRMPYSRGNTPLPEIAGGSPPVPPAPAPTPSGGPSASSSAPPAPPAPKKEEGQLRLTDVPAPTGNEESQLRLPALTPGQAIQQSLRGAARGRSSGAIPGLGDSDSQFNNPNSNFSIGGATILSDTRGVDFGPYLARVIYTVRRNWYSVIPISAQMGEKGRVALVFAIERDGAVPEIRLVGSSGSDPLDRAAESAIKLSTPFPQLPEEFSGNHLVLQFIFLYNLGTGP